MYAALAPHNNAHGVWFIASCVVLVGDKKRIATRLSYKERFPKRLTQELFSLASTPKPPTNQCSASNHRDLQDFDLQPDRLSVFDLANLSLTLRNVPINSSGTSQTFCKVANASKLLTDIGGDDFFAATLNNQRL